MLAEYLDIEFAMDKVPVSSRLSILQHFEAAVAAAGLQGTVKGSHSINLRAVETQGTAFATYRMFAEDGAPLPASNELKRMLETAAKIVNCTLQEKRHAYTFRIT